MSARSDADSCFMITSFTLLLCLEDVELELAEIHVNKSSRRNLGDMRSSYHAIVVRKTNSVCSNVMREDRAASKVLLSLVNTKTEKDKSTQFFCFTRSWQHSVISIASAHPQPIGTDPMLAQRHVYASQPPYLFKRQLRPYTRAAMKDYVLVHISYCHRICYSSSHALIKDNPPASGYCTAA